MLNIVPIPAVNSSAVSQPSRGVPAPALQCRKVGLCQCCAASWSIHAPVMQPVAPLDSVLLAFSPSLDYLAVATQDGRLRAFETSEHYARIGSSLILIVMLVYL